MTLEELITALESHDRAKVVPHGFATPHSYRGDYADLAFEPAANVTVGSMLDAARSALDATFEGYKGGLFTMAEYTDCWLAVYGCLGETIGVHLLRHMIDAADTAHLGARLAQAEAQRDHAEGELSSRIEQHMRAVNRATAAETEAERLRAALAVAQGETGTLTNRVHALEANAAELLKRAEKAERELDDMEGAVTDLGVVRLELQAAIERVKRYLDGIEAHCSANRADIPAWVGSVRLALGGGA